MKTLLFFTSQFPFDEGETFIENEFPFLLESFERIFIITNNLTGKQTRKIPDSVKVIRISYESSFNYKIQSLFNFLNPDIQQELKIISSRFHLSVNKKILLTLFGSYAKALEINTLIQQLVTEHKLNTGTLYLYSYWMNNMAAGIALFKNKHPETKAIYRAHGWDVYFERHSPPYLPLRNFIIRNSDACYCISENGLDYLDTITGKNLSGHLKLSRLGTFNSSRKSSFPNIGKLVIVSCSNIIPLKRIHLVIEALALIKDIPIEWIHFGEGPLKGTLKKLAQEKFASCPNIQYNFAGYISNPELLSFYSDNKVDVFINVSETEGLPVSIMEANSYSVPVLATTVGGVSEIVQQGENGFLLKPDSSPEEIAKAISQFYSLSTEQKNAMRKKAVEIWNEKFNAEMNYRSFISSLSAL